MIVGPNGAGKTHLLKALSSHEYSEGSVSLAINEVSFMPSQLVLPFNYKVFDLLLMSRYIHHKGHPKEKDRDIIKASLKVVGLSGKLTVRLKV